MMAIAVYVFELGRELLRWLRKQDWRILVILALAVFAGFQWVEARHWHKQYSGQIAGRAADRAEWKRQYEEAVAKATAAKTETEAAQEAARKDADDALETARAGSSRQLADYVRLHRPSGARAACNTDLPRPAGSAKVDNGTGGQAVVDEANLAICTANTDRLVNAHDWAARLQQSER